MNVSRNNSKNWIQYHLNTVPRKHMYKAKKQWIVASSLLISLLGIGAYQSTVHTHASTITSKASAQTTQTSNDNTSFSNNNQHRRAISQQAHRLTTDLIANSSQQKPAKLLPGHMYLHNDLASLNATQKNSDGNQAQNNTKSSQTHHSNASDTQSYSSQAVQNNQKPSDNRSQISQKDNGKKASNVTAQGNQQVKTNLVHNSHGNNAQPATNKAAKQASSVNGTSTDNASQGHSAKATKNAHNSNTGDNANSDEETTSDGFAKVIGQNRIIRNGSDLYILKNPISQTAKPSTLSIQYTNNGQKLHNAIYVIKKSDLNNQARLNDIIASQAPSNYQLASTINDTLDPYKDYTISIEVTPKAGEALDKNANFSSPNNPFLSLRRRFHYRRRRIHYRRRRIIRRRHKSSASTIPSGSGSYPDKYKITDKPTFAPDATVHANIAYALKGLPSRFSIVEKFMIGRHYIYTVSRSNKLGRPRQVGGKHIPSSAKSVDIIFRAPYTKNSRLVNFRHAQHMIINNEGHTQTLEEYTYRGKPYFLNVGGYTKSSEWQPNKFWLWGATLGRFQFRNGARIDIRSIPRIVNYKMIGSKIPIRRIDAGMTSDNSRIVVALRSSVHSTGRYLLLNRRKFDKLMNFVSQNNGKDGIKRLAIPSTSRLVRKIIIKETGLIPHVNHAMPNGSFQGIDIDNHNYMYIVGGSSVIGNKNSGDSKKRHQYRKDFNGTSGANNDPKILVAQFGNISQLTGKNRHMFDVKSSTWDYDTQNGSSTGRNNVNVEPESIQSLGSDVYIDFLLHSENGLNGSTPNHIYAINKEGFLVDRKEPEPTGKDWTKLPNGKSYVYAGMTGKAPASDACEVASIKMALSEFRLGLKVPLSVMTEEAVNLHDYAPRGRHKSPFLAGSGASMDAGHMNNLLRTYGARHCRILGNRHHKASMHQFIRFLSRGDPIVFEGSHKMKIDRSDHDLVALAYNSRKKKFLVADPYNDTRLQFWVPYKRFAEVYGAKNRHHDAVAVAK